MSHNFTHCTTNDYSQFNGLSSSGVIQCPVQNLRRLTSSRFYSPVTFHPTNTVKTSDDYWSILSCRLLASAVSPCNWSASADTVHTMTSIFGPILWGHSGPLSRVVVVDIDEQVACDWRCATVATPGEWQCKTGGVRRLAVANRPNIFQMLLVVQFNTNVVKPNYMRS